MTTRGSHLTVNAWWTLDWLRFQESSHRINVFSFLPWAFLLSLYVSRPCERRSALTWASPAAHFPVLAELPLLIWLHLNETTFRAADAHTRVLPEGSGSPEVKRSLTFVFIGGAGWWHCCPPPALSATFPNLFWIQRKGLFVLLKDAEKKGQTKEFQWGDMLNHLSIFLRWRGAWHLTRKQRRLDVHQAPPLLVLFMDTFHF